MNHLDTSVVAGVAMGVPIAIASRAGRRLLSRRGQDHLLVARGVRGPLCIARDRQGVTEPLASGVATVISVSVREWVGRVALGTTLGGQI